MSNLHKIMHGKLTVRPDDLSAGDVVEITRANAHDGESITYKTELYQPYPYDSGYIEDGLGNVVRTVTRVLSNSIDSIKIIKKFVIHNFYTNADRAPVEGDAYIFPHGHGGAKDEVYVIGTSSVGCQMSLDWAREIDKQVMSPKRILLWDAVNGKVVN